ncbi:MAG: hypothetical protein EOM20_00065 [Spartobacteria bacterium]|nr:hypothetical protein [Spartobacteria bacterium]
MSDHPERKTMQAIILTGGKGTRLSQLYADRPKPLVPVEGKPFLQWQVEWLAEKGIREVHLAAGHMGEKIVAWAASDPVAGVRITASVEPERLGTGGGIKFVESFIRTDPFFVLNGDSLAPNLDFQSLEKAHAHFSNHWKNSAKSFQSLEKSEEKFPIIGKIDKKVSNDWKNAQPGFVTIAVTHIEQTGRYGTVEFTEEGRVTAFLEKTERKSGWINAGVYLIDRSLLDNVPPEENLSIETDIFPKLTTAGFLFATAAPGPLLDMGTPEGLASMETWLRSRP